MTRRHRLAALIAALLLASTLAGCTDSTEPGGCRSSSPSWWPFPLMNCMPY